MAKKLVKKQPVAKKLLVKTSDSEKKEILIKKENPEKKEKIDFKKVKEFHLTIFSLGRLEGPQKTTEKDYQEVFISHDDLPAMQTSSGGYLKSAKAFSGMVRINHKDRKQTMCSKNITLSASTVFSLMEIPTRKFTLKDWNSLNQFRKLEEIANEYSEGFGVEITPGY